jgi:hypothetical protein
MPLRRRLTAIRLDKIAAVDSPCQQHATVAIVKRAPDAQAIAKATFQEALEGQLVASRVNEAFYSSFNGLWERNDAFRTALTDELAAGGDGAAASGDYVASVKALVDEAVTAARAAGANATDDQLNKALTTAAENWLAAKSTPKEQGIMKITNKAELGSAITSALAKGLALSVGEVATIQKAATDLGAEDALPADGPLAKAAPAGDPALVRKVAILEMPADVRKHFETLTTPADQDAFLKMDPAARAADVAKRNEGDPVVFTTSDGIEIRKSDGRTAELLARQNDKLNKRVDELAQDHAEATLQKRAAAFPNVAEDVAIDMLKGVDAVGPTTEKGKALQKALDRMNAASGKLFKSVGTDAGGPGGDVQQGGDAAAKSEFNQAVEKAAVDLKIPRADAMTKVRRDQPELFAKAFPGAVEPEDGDENA